MKNKTRSQAARKSVDFCQTGRQSENENRAGHASKTETLWAVAGLICGALVLNVKCNQKTSGRRKPANVAPFSGEPVLIGLEDGWETNAS